MKTKMLFVIPSMEIGGTRSSLLNLLNLLSQIEDVDLYLFIIKHEGDLYTQIPKSVTVLPEIKLLSWATPTRHKHSIFRMLFHSCVAIVNKVIGYQRVYRFLLKTNRSYSINSIIYDVSIGYQEGIATFLSSVVKANRYYAWIHSDIDKWFDAKNFEADAYNKVQNIFFVAENTRILFASKFPKWAGKCEVIKNILNKDAIIQRAQEPVTDLVFDKSIFNIVSIGRFSEAKAFDRVIEVAKFLKSNNHSFRWFLIGSGELYGSIEKKVLQENLTDYVLLLGPKNNPFPYIRMSDLVVVPSINESQPMVILEALTLSRPIISTGYPSAIEILQDSKFGLICGNNVSSLCDSVDRVMNDNELYEKLLAGARSYEYDNDSILQKMRRLMSF